MGVFAGGFGRFWRESRGCPEGPGQCRGGPKGSRAKNPLRAQRLSQVCLRIQKLGGPYWTPLGSLCLNPISVCNHLHARQRRECGRGAPEAQAGLSHLLCCTKWAPKRDPTWMPKWAPNGTPYVLQNRDPKRVPNRDPKGDPKGRLEVAPLGSETLLVPSAPGGMNNLKSAPRRWLHIQAGLTT